MQTIFGDKKQGIKNPIHSREYQEGRSTQLSGAPDSQCPYRHQGKDFNDKRYYWMLGYWEAHFNNQEK